MAQRARRFKGLPPAPKAPYFYESGEEGKMIEGHLEVPQLTIVYVSISMWLTFQTLENLVWLVIFRRGSEEEFWG